MRPNYTRLVQKKYKTEYAVKLSYFYFSLDDHKKLARKCEDYGIVWTNLIREFLTDAFREESKRYTKHLKENDMNDDSYIPFLGYYTKFKARNRYPDLKKEFKDEKIRLHKAFYVLHAKTGREINPHLVWLMRDQHKIDDHALFEHLLEMMVQEGTLEEIINTTKSGEEYYMYRPTVTIKRKRFRKTNDNPFVDSDLRFHETGAANVKAGVNVPTRRVRGRKSE